MIRIIARAAATSSVAAPLGRAISLRSNGFAWSQKANISQAAGDASAVCASTNRKHHGQAINEPIGRSEVFSISGGEQTLFDEQLKGCCKLMQATIEGLISWQCWELLSPMTGKIVIDEALAGESLQMAEWIDR